MHILRIVLLKAIVQSKANSRYVGGEWYKDCCGGQPFVLLRIKVATEGFQTKYNKNL